MKKPVSTHQAVRLERGGDIIVLAGLENGEEVRVPIEDLAQDFPVGELQKLVQTQARFCLDRGKWR